MAKIVVVGQCKDPAKWEEGFRTHRDLFRSYSADSVSYSIGKGNRVAVCFEPRDVATALKLIESPDTAKAMETDGFLRETAEIFVMDKGFTV